MLSTDPSPSTEAARTPEVPTSMTRMLTAHRSRPAQFPEGRRQSELARIEDAAGIEGVLDGDQDVERTSQCRGHEAGPVYPYPVMMADGPTLGHDAVHDGAPGVSVVRLGPGVRGRLRRG